MGGRRILILNWKDLKHPRAGGGTFYTHKLACYLHGKGHDVTLLTAKYPGAKGRDVIDGVRVLRLGNKYTVYSRAAFKYLKDLTQHFDIVIDEINYIPWFTPLYIVDTPILAFIHQTGQGLLVQEAGRILGTFLRTLERATPLLYRNIPMITVSESVREELVQSGFHPAWVTVIPPGIDVEKYRVKLSEKAGHPLLLYVGRLTRYKGIEHLIRAAHYLIREKPDLRVSIVGKGDYLQTLVRLRDDLSLRQVVRFHGYVSEREKIRLMQKARLLVNPSVREGWSIVVIEAGACGTPAVGTDTTGLRDSILPGKTGLLAPYGKPRDLAAKIVEALTPDVWAHLSENAQAWASKFDWSKTLPKFENAIRDTIEDYNSRENKSRTSYDDLYYAGHIKKIGTKWGRHRLKSVSNLIGSWENGVMLDLGCGIGTFTIIFSKKNSYVVGVDLSATATKIAKSLLRKYGMLSNAEIVRADVQHLPFRCRSISKILCADLVEHLYSEQYHPLLSECRRVLGKGGSVGLYTPNPAHIFEKLKSHNLILRRDESHVGLRSPQYIRESLKNHGFSIVKDYFLESHVLFFNVLEKALMRIPFISKYFSRRICVLAQVME